MKLFVFILSVLFTFNGISQSELETFVKEGIALHDQGEFDSAIASYEKALVLDSLSPLVHYELALSYFAKGDYDNTLKHSDLVLAQNKDFLLEAYLTKGSALDIQGKISESIQLFETAIAEKGGHYLLYYNLALNYFKMDNMAMAEENIINAIASNTNHSSSHYMLAAIHDKNGNSAQSLLATYYFLFLEPNSARSPEGMKMIDDNFGRNVSKDEENPNTTNITLFEGGDDQFRAAELMISMLKASELTEENENKTKAELFMDHTKAFFDVIKPQEDPKNDEIWWAFYQPFYSVLADSDHFETFCKYISQNTYKSSKEWLESNPEKLTEFGEWLKVN